MHTAFSKLTICAAIAGMGLLLAAAPAFALSLPAYPDNSLVGTACFQETDGGVRNNCGAQKDYYIPLAVNPGAHTVGVSTYNPGGGTFSCQLGYWGGSSIIPTFGTAVFPNTGFANFDISITIPNDGQQDFMFVYCNINPGGVVYDILGYAE